jgi:hypothetical protein
MELTERITTARKLTPAQRQANPALTIADLTSVSRQAHYLVLRQQHEPASPNIKAAGPSCRPAEKPLIRPVLSARWRSNHSPARDTNPIRQAAVVYEPVAEEPPEVMAIPCMRCVKPLNLAGIVTASAVGSSAIA